MEVPIPNPAAINGNTVVSQAAAAGSAPSFVAGATPTLTTPYAADDDGGFFRWKAWSTSPMIVPAAGTPPLAPQNLRIATP
jgi:hypothetical protein